MSDRSFAVNAPIRSRADAKLIEEITVVSDILKIVFEAKPIDLSLTGKPMALVYEIVVGDVRGDNIFADLSYEFADVLAEKMIRVKAYAKVGVSGDNVEQLVRAVAKASAWKLLNSYNTSLGFCIFSKLI